MYKYLFHADYTIDDDGRWHSKNNGKFMPKPDELSNDELAKLNKRRSLENKYEQLYPSRKKQVAEGLSGVQSGSNTAGNALRQVRLKEKKNPRADLSNISDEQLRKILNREQMERQYDQLFNTPTENKGQKFINGLSTGLTIAAGVAGLAVAGVTIYDKLTN
jgi:hypothetical protein